MYPVRLKVDAIDRVGLLHDMDYERHPDMDDTENGHPRTELRYFEEHDYPPELIQAVRAVVHGGETPARAFEMYNTLRNEI